MLEKGFNYKNAKSNGNLFPATTDKSVKTRFLFALVQRFPLTKPFFNRLQHNQNPHFYCQCSSHMHTHMRHSLFLSHRVECVAFFRPTPISTVVPSTVVTRTAAPPCTDGGKCNKFSRPTTMSGYAASSGNGMLLHHYTPARGHLQPVMGREMC